MRWWKRRWPDTGAPMMVTPLSVTWVPTEEPSTLPPRSLAAQSTMTAPR